MQIIGMGTDIVETLRIAQMIERHGEVFLRRVYTKREIEYCSSRKAATQHYAGRWAVKEAVLKALGTGWSRGIQWVDMEVVNEPGGRPILELGGKALVVASEKGIDDVQISLSHCRNYATATAIAVALDESM